MICYNVSKVAGKNEFDFLAEMQQQKAKPKIMIHFEEN